MIIYEQFIFSLSDGFYLHNGYEAAYIKIKQISSIMLLIYTYFFYYGFSLI